MKRLILLVIAMLLFAGCASESSVNGSSDPVGDWWERVEPHVARFIELDDIAGATGRVYMSHVLVEMTDSWVAFSYEGTPEEAMPIYYKGYEFMRYTIDSYIYFMREIPYENAHNNASAARTEFFQLLAEHGYSIEHITAQFYDLEIESVD